MHPHTRTGLAIILLIAMLLLGAGTSSVSAEHVPDPSGVVYLCGQNVDSLYGHTIRHSIKNKLPPYLLAAIAWRESRWHPDAVNDTGRYRAEGLMQIVADPWHPSMVGWTLDPCASIDYAGRYVAGLLVKHNYQLDKALDEYSGGAHHYYLSIVGYMERAARARG